jgi:hypothetical protein
LDGEVAGYNPIWPGHEWRPKVTAPIDPEPTKAEAICDAIRLLDANGYRVMFKDAKQDSLNMQHDEHVWAWRQYRSCLFGLHAFVLQMNQEPLGAVFQDVLHENFWDLYARG